MKKSNTPNDKNNTNNTNNTNNPKVKLKKTRNPERDKVYKFMEEAQKEEELNKQEQKPKIEDNHTKENSFSNTKNSSSKNSSPLKRKNSPEKSIQKKPSYNDVVHSPLKTGKIPFIEKVMSFIQLAEDIKSAGENLSKVLRKKDGLSQEEINKLFELQDSLNSYTQSSSQLEEESKRIKNNVLPDARNKIQDILPEQNRKDLNKQVTEKLKGKERPTHSTNEESQSEGGFKDLFVLLQKMETEQKKATSEEYSLEEKLKSFSKLEENQKEFETKLDKLQNPEGTLTFKDSQKCNELRGLYSKLGDIQKLKVQLEAQKEIKTFLNLSIEGMEQWLKDFELDKAINSNGKQLKNVAKNVLKTPKKSQNELIFQPELISELENKIGNLTLFKNLKKAAEDYLKDFSNTNVESFKQFKQSATNFGSDVIKPLINSENAELRAQGELYKAKTRELTNQVVEVKKQRKSGDSSPTIETEEIQVFKGEKQEDLNKNSKQQDIITVVPTIVFLETAREHKVKVITLPTLIENNQVIDAQRELGNSSPTNQTEETKAFNVENSKLYFDLINIVNSHSTTNSPPTFISIEEITEDSVNNVFLPASEILSQNSSLGYNNKNLSLVIVTNTNQAQVFNYQPWDYLIGASKIFDSLKDKIKPESKLFCTVTTDEEAKYLLSTYHEKELTEKETLNGNDLSTNNQAVSPSSLPTSTNNENSIGDSSLKETSTEKEIEKINDLGTPLNTVEPRNYKDVEPSPVTPLPSFTNIEKSNSVSLFKEILKGKELLKKYDEGTPLNMVNSSNPQHVDPSPVTPFITNTSVETPECEYRSLQKEVGATNRCMNNLDNIMKDLDKGNLFGSPTTPEAVSSPKTQNSVGGGMPQEEFELQIEQQIKQFNERTQPVDKPLKEMSPINENSHTAPLSDRQKLNAIVNNTNKSGGELNNLCLNLIQQKETLESEIEDNKIVIMKLMKQIEMLIDKSMKLNEELKQSSITKLDLVQKEKSLLEEEILRKNEQIIQFEVHQKKCLSEIDTLNLKVIELNLEVESQTSTSQSQYSNFQFLKSIHEGQLKEQQILAEKQKEQIVGLKEFNQKNLSEIGRLESEVNELKVLAELKSNESNNQISLLLKENVLYSLYLKEQEKMIGKLNEDNQELVEKGLEITKENQLLAEESDELKKHIVKLKQQLQEDKKEYLAKDWLKASSMRQVLGSEIKRFEVQETVLQEHSNRLGEEIEQLKKALAETKKTKEIDDKEKQALEEEVRTLKEEISSLEEFNSESEFVDNEKQTMEDELILLTEKLSLLEFNAETIQKPEGKVEQQQGPAKESVTVQSIIQTELPKETLELQGKVEKISVQEEQFQALINQFEEISNELQVKKIYNLDYSEAAEVSEDLYQTLKLAGKEFFARPTPESFANFRCICRESINDVRDELQQHQEFWPSMSPIFRGFLGVIAALTVIPALVVATTQNQGYLGVFFGTPEKPRAAQKLAVTESQFDTMCSAIEKGMAVGPT